MNQISISDISGYDEEKRDASLLAHILKNFTSYQKKGVYLPKGVLFTGYSGVGKTLFAKAIAGEAGASLVEYSKSEADGEDVEPYLEQLFKEAKSKAPCVLLFDDMDGILSEDKIGPSRKEAIVQAFTKALDDLELSDGVLVVATASRFRVLPSSLTRNGRIDHHIFLAFPDIADRKAILGACLHKLNCKMDLDVMADRTRCFGPAELKSIVREAALNATAEGRGCVLEQDFDQALIRVNWSENFRDPKTDCTHICYHELGHFLVDRELNHAHNSASVYRSSQYRGFVMNDKDDEFIWAKNKENDIATALAGIVAQRIYCHDTDLGGGSDFEAARNNAENLLDNGYCGMDRALDEQGSKERDRAMRRLLRRGYRRAAAVLRKPSNRKLIQYLMPILKQKRYLSSAELEALIADYSTHHHKGAHTSIA